MSGSGNVAYAWDLTQPEPVGSLVSQCQQVRDLWFDSQGKLALIAAGYNNGAIELVDVSSGVATRRTLPAVRGAIAAAKFSRDGRRLVYDSSWFENKNVPTRFVLDLTAEPITERAVPDATSALFALSPDGEQLATIGADRLKLWDLSLPNWEAPVAILNAPNWRWQAIAFVAEERGLLAADDLGRVLAWDMATKKRIGRIAKATGGEMTLWQMPGAVREIIPSPDGRYLATANCDGSVYILRVDQLFPPAPAAQH